MEAALDAERATSASAAASGSNSEAEFERVVAARVLAREEAAEAAISAAEARLQESRCDVLWAKSLYSVEMPQ